MPKRNPLTVANALLKNYAKTDYIGYDPFDLKAEGFFFSLQRLGVVGRLVVDVIDENLPMAARRLFGVRKRQNNKGLALFLLGCCELYEKTGEERYLKEAMRLYRFLLRNKSSTKNLSFGYPFRWYTKQVVPANTPNVVVSGFVGQALLRLYSITRDKTILEDCLSIGRFLLDDMPRQETKDELCFSYTLVDKKQVHNANLLAAQYLASLSTHVKDKKLKQELLSTVKKAVTFALNDMNDDYSWHYFKGKIGGIDNYHTAFILESLWKIHSVTKDDRIKKVLPKAYAFYKRRLFFKGIPILATTQRFPINIHSCASAIICLDLFEGHSKKNHLLWQVHDFTMKEMWGGEHFYYYANRLRGVPEMPLPFRVRLRRLLVLPRKNKARFARWNDAWMFYALTKLVKHNKNMARIFSLS